MKKKRDYVKIISTALAMVTFLVLLISLFFSDQGNIRLKTTPAIDISSGWKNLDTGEVEESKFMEILPGASVKLSRILPDYLNDDNVVGYYDYGFRVIAYVDNEEIYSNGGDNYGRFGTQMSQAWRAIPLKEGYEGKTLTVIFENDTDATMRINLERMQITYESSQFVRAITTSGWALFIILACIIMSVVLLIFSIVLWKAGFGDNCHRMLMLAVLSLTVGVWSWANSSLGQLIFTNEASGYNISYLSYFFIPMFWGLFYERIYKESNLLFYILNTSYRFVLVAVYILYLVGKVPIAQSVFLAHAYLFTELLVGNFYGVRAYIRLRNHANHWSMIGQLIFLLVSAVYIPLYYLRGEEHVYIYAGLAFLLFLICMTLSQGYYLLRDLIERQRELEYRERSRTNPMTGGNSWLGLSYRLEEMDFHGIDAPWFLVMELTNFSSVNALFGWKSGAKILRGIFQTNQSCLEEGDFQASDGESEFVFMTPAEKDVEDFCRRLEDGLRQYMKEEWQNAFLSLRFMAARVNPGDDVHKLMACAHLAYSGRNPEETKDTYVYYYDGACYDRTIKSQVVENEVNRAMLKDQTYLLITPVYDVESGKICQADTSLAWNVKAEGDAFEYEFVPNTEKDALGLYMNRAHFKKALECLATYPDLGKLRISIRVFPDCVMDKTFWKEFQETRENLGIQDLQGVDFELPMEMGKNVIPTLKEIVGRLHEKGATVSAAKFDGSLETIQMIKELKVDWVKFDRKLLIEANASSPELYMQIEHLVNILHQQGQKVCICGVREQKEVESLRRIGADRMRGAGLHKPLLQENFMQLLIDDKEGQNP